MKIHPLKLILPIIIFISSCSNNQREKEFERLEIWKNLISIKLNDTGKKNLKIGIDEINIKIDVNEKEFWDLTDKLNLIFEPEKGTIIAYNNNYK